MHNATVVRSHGGCGCVEIEWARRQSGGRKLRSPREILGKRKEEGAVIIVMLDGGCCTAKSLHVGRGESVEEEGCVVRQRMEE